VSLFEIDIGARCEGFRIVGIGKQRMVVISQRFLNIV
jgi:hypothetical protein